MPNRSNNCHHHVETGSQSAAYNGILHSLISNYGKSYQEHERMKLAFERQREQDRAKFSARAVAVPEGQGSEGIDSLSGQTVVKTFSQAKDRIR